jgi:hypothetical protein
MPARTLNDFFAGFFYSQTKADLEISMANTRQNDRRKSIRRESSRRKTDIKTIKIEGKEDNEQEVPSALKLPSKRKQAQCGAGMKNLQSNGARLF